VFAGPPDAGIKAGDVDQRQPHRLGVGEGALEGRRAPLRSWGPWGRPPGGPSSPVLTPPS
jgi:hypothetical protein